jgi:hypothetical protein
MLVLTNLDGEVEELDPEDLETFEYVEGQSEENFNDLMSRPGLDALPHHLGTVIRDLLNGEYYGSYFLDNISPFVVSELKAMAEIAGAEVAPFIELGCWAAAVWMMGPLGETFRQCHFYIYDVCSYYGECIVLNGCVYSPEDYTKQARAPRSCVVCGLDSYCVDLVYVEGVTRHLCEFHVNGTNGMMCGQDTVDIQNALIIQWRVCKCHSLSTLG